MEARRGAYPLDAVGVDHGGDQRPCGSPGPKIRRAGREHALTRLVLTVPAVGPDRVEPAFEKSDARVMGVGPLRLGLVDKCGLDLWTLRVLQRHRAVTFPLRTVREGANGGAVPAGLGGGIGRRPERRFNRPVFIARSVEVISRQHPAVRPDDAARVAHIAAQPVIAQNDLRAPFVAPIGTESRPHAVGFGAITVGQRDAPVRQLHE